MENYFKKILETYKVRYNKILTSYYPSHGSTGFTERNMSVNFAHSVELISNDTIVWYEAPFGSRNREHFDAVIIDKTTKSIFIIESKRFTVPKQKLYSIGEDMKRIVNKSNIRKVTANYNDITSNSYNVYGVILADVWTENPIKTEIFDNWGSSFTETYASDLNLDSEIAMLISSALWDKFEFNISETLKKYKLLTLIFKIS